MADKKYVDNVLDEDNTRYYLKDSKLTERFDKFKQDVEDGAYSVVPSDSDSARSIYNINESSSGFFRVWIGTREEYNSLSFFESDVVYFIGTPTGGSDPTPEIPKHTVTNNISSSSHCYFSNNARYVNDGDSFTGTFTAETGYTMVNVTVKIGTTSYTVYNYGSSNVYDDGNMSYTVDENFNGILTIRQVTDNIEISATAIIVLKSIRIIQVYQEEPSNKITLRADLTPFNTSQTNVRWGIPDTATYFRLDANGLTATLRVLEGADDASVSVSCSSLDNPSISAPDHPITGITYVTPEIPGPDEPVNPEDKVIVFPSAEQSIKETLLSKGWGSAGEITVEQAKIAKLTKSECQNLFKNNTAITQFTTWKYFTTSFFNVSGCTNLTTVNIPLLQTAFTEDFGIKNTAITNLVIPEGYTSIASNSGYGDGLLIFADSTNVKLQSISFPSTLHTVSVGFRNLTGITELDFSRTSLQTICSNLCMGLTSLTTVKFPDTLVSTGFSQIFRGCSNLSRVEFGTGFRYFGTAETSMGLFYDTGTSVQVTVVFHGTTRPENFNLGHRQSIDKIDKILVPASAEASYKEDVVSNPFREYISKISTIESELSNDD